MPAGIGSGPSGLGVILQRFERAITEAVTALRDLAEYADSTTRALEQYDRLPLSAKSDPDKLAARAKLAAGAALRVEEAALLLSVSPKTLRGWRFQASRGRYAPALEFRRYGGCVRVSAASVRALLSEFHPNQR